MAGGATVRFRVDGAGEDRLLRDPAGPLGQWLARKGNQMVNEAKRNARVDTGLMRSRVEFEMQADGAGLVGLLSAKTSYSIYVHAYDPFLLDAVRATLSR